MFMLILYSWNDIVENNKLATKWLTVAFCAGRQASLFCGAWLPPVQFDMHNRCTAFHLGRVTLIRASSRNLPITRFTPQVPRQFTTFFFLSGDGD